MPNDFNRDSELGEDYYTFLNLPKDATKEEIIASYRKLSRIYHPDKHAGPENKQNAELLFNRIKRAYEVLSDPHKRAIYDSVGEKGLHTEGWEIMHRTKSATEIRDEYARLANVVEERKLQQRTNPRGNFIISVNATEIFSPYDEEDFPRIEVASMNISQSIEAPLTRKDTLFLNGNLYSCNGNGSGNFILSGRRLVNKGWLECNLSAGNGPMLGFKCGRVISPILTFNGGTSFGLLEAGISPSFFTALAVQLDKYTVGSLTLNASRQSSMTTQLDGNKENYAWSTSIVIGNPHIYFNLAYTRKMIENELKLKLAVK